jgi:hypothetical protein
MVSTDRPSGKEQQKFNNFVLLIRSSISLFISTVDYSLFFSCHLFFNIIIFFVLSKKNDESKPKKSIKCQDIKILQKNIYLSIYIYIYICLCIYIYIHQYEK